MSFRRLVRNLRKESEMKMFDRPLVGIATVVRRDGKVLLHKRKSKHAYGTWAFAGGHLEKWEYLSDCAMRELREEAGDDLVVTTPLCWVVTNNFHLDEDKHYVTLFMVGDWVSGEAKIMEPDKCEAWEWFSWDDLPHPLMLGIENLLKCGLNPLVPAALY